MKLKKSDLSNLCTWELEYIKIDCRWHVEWQSDGFTIIQHEDDSDNLCFLAEGATLFAALRNAIYAHLKCPICLDRIRKQSKTFSQFEKKTLENRE